MKVYYDLNHKRLVYVGQRPTASWWDARWCSTNSNVTIEDRKNDRFILSILSYYIRDKEGRILEGGCGIGQVLYCMYFHGYKATGVDFAEETVRRIREINPELDARVGDVRNLEFPDGYFVAYWSLGVIEHCWEGYHDILDEMSRVLMDGGYLFLAFPYMSVLRRLKARIGMFKKFDPEQKEAFYQFALDSETVIKDFQMVGFSLVDKKPIDGVTGLKDEVGLLWPLLHKLRDYRGENVAVRGLSYFLDRVVVRFSAHEIFLVFRKTESTSNY